MSIFDRMITSFLVAAVILAGLTAIVFRRTRASVAESPILVESSTAAPAPAASGPKCIHEVCAERPRYLLCVDWNPFPASAACGRFEISYEHHCECDRWEP